MDFGQMSPQHMLYIPSMVLLGLVTGYVLGARAVRAEIDRRRRKMKE